MCVQLALKARESYAIRGDALGSPGAGRAIFTATLASVLFTVLGMGSGIYGILNKYQAFDIGGSLEEDQGLQADRRGSSLLKFDRVYLKPVFVRPDKPSSLGLAEVGGGEPLQSRTHSSAVAR